MRAKNIEYQIMCFEAMPYSASIFSKYYIGLKVKIYFNKVWSPYSSQFTSIDCGEADRRTLDFFHFRHHFLPTRSSRLFGVEDSYRR